MVEMIALIAYLLPRPKYDHWVQLPLDTLNQSSKVDRGVLHAERVANYNIHFYIHIRFIFMLYYTRLNSYLGEFCIIAFKGDSLSVGNPHFFHVVCNSPSKSLNIHRGFRSYDGLARVFVLKQFSF